MILNIEQQWYGIVSIISISHFYTIYIILYIPTSTTIIILTTVITTKQQPLYVPPSNRMKLNKIKYYNNSELYWHREIEKSQRFLKILLCHLQAAYRHITRCHCQRLVGEITKHSHGIIVGDHAP